MAFGPTPAPSSIPGASTLFPESTRGVLIGAAPLPSGCRCHARSSRQTAFRAVRSPAPSRPWPGACSRASSAEIDVRPLERHDLAAPESGVAAEQHGDVDARVNLLSRIQLGLGPSAEGGLHAILPSGEGLGSDGIITSVPMQLATQSRKRGPHAGREFNMSSVNETSADRRSTRPSRAYREQERIHCAGTNTCDWSSTGRTASIFQ
jgi:hypothetical protein